RLRSLEHAASERNSARTLSYAVAERCTWGAGGGIGLHEGATGIDCKMAPTTAGGSGHGRFRPQREPSLPARFLRGRCEAHCIDYAERAGARKADQARDSSASCEGTG